MKMNISVNPEIVNSIKTGNFLTNYHDVGTGFPVVMFHGSGPGVTAWANWRLVMPEMAKVHPVFALYRLGFGYTERPARTMYSKDLWVLRLKFVLVALELKQADLVGISFGVIIAIAFAIAYPERVLRFVLVGSVGL